MQLQKDSSNVEARDQLNKLPALEENIKLAKTFIEHGEYGRAIDSLTKPIEVSMGSSLG
jgi:hypothetical protein